MTPHFAEIMRYAINGLAATAVHYGVLSINLIWLDLNSAGKANFIAALFGITFSFLGNRYFVFQNRRGNIIQDAAKFCLLYGFIAVLHGLFLWLWTDLNGFDFRVGFLLATVAQITLSYFGNRLLVFKI